MVKVTATKVGVRLLGVAHLLGVPGNGDPADLARPVLPQDR